MCNVKITLVLVLLFLLDPLRNLFLKSFYLRIQISFLVYALLLNMSKAKHDTLSLSLDIPYIQYTLLYFTDLFLVSILNNYSLFFFIFYILIHYLYYYFFKLYILYNFILISICFIIY